MMITTAFVLFENQVELKTMAIISVGSCLVWCKWINTGESLVLLTEKPYLLKNPAFKWSLLFLLCFERERKKEEEAKSVLLKRQINKSKGSDFNRPNAGQKQNITCCLKPATPFFPPQWEFIALHWFVLLLLQRAKFRSDTIYIELFLCLLHMKVK